MARRNKPKVRVEVIWRASDGTASLDVYTARHAVSTMIPDGPAVVALVDGRDDTGPVSGVTYRQADRIKHRPVGKRDNR